jgi:hypothetical protein
LPNDKSAGSFLQDRNPFARIHGRRQSLADEGRTLHPTERKTTKIVLFAMEQARRPDKTVRDFNN